MSEYGEERDEADEDASREGGVVTKEGEADEEG